MRELLEGSLPEGEQARLEAHLEGSEACRRAFDAVAAEGRFWDDLRRFARPGREEILPAEDPDDDDERLDFLDPDPSPGRIGWLGRYEVLEILGRGGMGIVLKAFDPGLHRIAAIKVLSPRLATSASARRRFLREARAAASVAHEHVVTIHAVDEVKGLPYLVMQYVTGRSLQQRIERDGPLELDAILRIGMQTAAGLAAAHAQGLVHRDVKPANILLENGIERVKITDFGLARAVDDASLTQSGIVAGTPVYMAPEQARGESVDHRCDLFSVGSVLYAMCTGRSPFRAETTVAVLKRVCDDTTRPIRDVNPSMPEWLVGIVARLHAKDPADRFQSATEVAEVLGRNLAQLQQPTTTVVPMSGVAPGGAPPPAPGLEFHPIPAAKEIATRKSGWTGLVRIVASFGLFLAALALFVAIRPDGVQDLIATIRRAIMREEDQIRDGALPLPRLKTELTGPTADRSTDRIEMPGEIRVLQGHSNWIEAIAAPADGRFAISGGNDNTLRRWDLSTGRGTPMIEIHYPISDLAISADGRFVVYGSLDQVVYFWDIQTGSGEPLTGHRRKVRAVAIARDGQFALSGSEDDKLCYWDLAQSKELRRLAGHTKGTCSVAISPDGRLGLSGSVDGTARLWDLERGTCLRVLAEGRPWVTAVAFMPTGRYAIIGRQDGTLSLVDVDHGSEVRRFAGHRTYVRNVRASSDGRLILSAGSGALRLWDATTGDEVYQLEGVGGGIVCGIILPGSREVLFGCYDSTVRLWRLPASLGKRSPH
jgi:hypothetical protein